MSDIGEGASREQAAAFLVANPELRFIDVFMADLNGVLRGKRLRPEATLKSFDAGMRLPRSIVSTDIWGNDVPGTSLLFESGDRDGACLPVGAGLLPVPWAAEPTAQLLTMMQETSGEAFDADPRQQLVNALDALAERGLRPVVAFELEFSVLAARFDDYGRPTPPPHTGKARRAVDGRIYEMNELDAHAEFIAALYSACEAQDLPLESVIIEAGPGQFEANLRHRANPLQAADDALLLRRAIKGVAARHDLLASFMAKPFSTLAGNGMHVHLSLLGDDGRNLFDDGSPAGSGVLRQAVAGLAVSAPEAMILFAPHSNSMRRFRHESHAPTSANWGYDNRTVAIRIPASDGINRRLEHRIAGADANPMLVLSAMLRGILHGIDAELVPSDPVEGSGYDAPGRALPTDWAGALQAFVDGDILPQAFGPLFARVYEACKRQELAVTDERITDFEYDTYLQRF